MRIPPDVASEKEFMALFHAGFVVDGRLGGLVVGRSHAAGNIYMIQPDGAGGFGLAGHLEGGEYLVSYAAWLANPGRLEELNNDRTPHNALLNLIPIGLRTLNTTAEPLDRLLYVSCEGQFIVNKWATAKHLEEINRINESAVAEFPCLWLNPNA